MNKLEDVQDPRVRAHLPDLGTDSGGCGPRSTSIEVASCLVASCLRDPTLRCRGRAEPTSCQQRSHEATISCPVRVARMPADSCWAAIPEPITTVTNKPVLTVSASNRRGRRQGGHGGDLECISNTRGYSVALLLHTVSRVLSRPYKTALS